MKRMARLGRVIVVGLAAVGARPADGGPPAPGASVVDAKLQVFVTR